MAKLKAGGMPGAKFFTKEDLDGLSPEEMGRKFGGNKSPSSKRKKKEDKKSKIQTKTLHEDEEIVEL